MIARTLLSISGHYDERRDVWFTKSLLLKPFFESLKHSIEGHWVSCAPFSQINPTGLHNRNKYSRDIRGKHKTFQEAETLGLDTHVSAGIPYYSVSLLTVVLKSCVLYRRAQIVSKLISRR